MLKLTLHDTSYDSKSFRWRASFTDSGSGVVHGPPLGNQAPTVDAGPDQGVPTGSASLGGTVTDDGLPGPSTATWSKTSGPGTVAFADAHAVATTAYFSAAGVFDLQLSANDGQFIGSDTLSVTVTTASGNLPPVVVAGPDRIVTLPAEAALAGEFTDDGLPGSDIATNWTKVSGPGTVTFGDPFAAGTPAAFSAAGTYVLRLSADDGDLVGSDDLTVTVHPVETNNAIDFGGTNAYVTFGPAPALGVSTMTIEAWFRARARASRRHRQRRRGPTPIVSKGRAEQDGSNVDMNYFLGIDGQPSGRRLRGHGHRAEPPDHGRGGDSGQPDGLASCGGHLRWDDVAVYLDGSPDGTLVAGAFTPRFDSIQHAAIGSALTSTGAAAGFFDGPIDEVRIWNRALSREEIQANINQQITGAPNLVARFGLNEGGSTEMYNSTSPLEGAVTGINWAWTTGAPFNLVFNQAPSQPVLNAPANGATGQSTSPFLNVTVSDPDGDPLAVSFYGRQVPLGSQPDFTLVALPDTQHYVDDVTRAATFTAQTQWIVDNKAALNIPFVSHLGDIVENIDGVPVEWTRADASMTVLDNGQVAYGIAPGNHDENSAGWPPATTPTSRCRECPDIPGMADISARTCSASRSDRPANKNNFELFSAGGMDFIVIQLEYDMPGYSVDWANRVLAAYPNRRAIVATHLFLDASGNRPSTVLNRPDGTPAATVWSQLIYSNCNVFLVLNGHYPGEANRTDLNSCGQPVHQLLADYQSRANGGDGWLRYMTFKPAENKIYVYTFSPTLNGGLGQFEADANSQFVLDYNMDGVPFAPIATNTGVTSGNSTQTTWPGLAPNSQYQWYVTVSDGLHTITGPSWEFTTAAGGPVPPSIVTNPTPQIVTAPAQAVFAVVAGGDPPLSYQWQREVVQARLPTSRVRPARRAR